MRDYVATFFSHYDALTFFSYLKSKNVSAKLMPVPRKVSAACGTCVSFLADSDVVKPFLGRITFSAESDGCAAKLNLPDCEIEALYIKTPDNFLKMGVD